MTPETYSSNLSEIKIQAVWHGHVKHKQWSKQPPMRQCHASSV
jgi:hypothetical protein